MAGAGADLDLDRIPEEALGHRGASRGRAFGESLPRPAYLGFDRLDDAVVQTHVGGEPEGGPLLALQALQAVFGEPKGFERGAPVVGEGGIEVGARRHPRQQTDRVQEIALAGGVGAEDDRQRVELHVDAARLL
ncbi:MAG TPA: hypothetical protein VFD49_24255 [Candidatus Dormibacteraeota bacterium]|nr:hypothetical protein [Candidatus Dormibacteraeota bacterium]